MPENVIDRESRKPRSWALSPEHAKAISDQVQRQEQELANLLSNLPEQDQEIPVHVHKILDKMLKIKWLKPTIKFIQVRKPLYDLSKKQLYEVLASIIKNQWLDPNMIQEAREVIHMEDRMWALYEKLWYTQEALDIVITAIASETDDESYNMDVIQNLATRVLIRKKAKKIMQTINTDDQKGIQAVWVQITKNDKILAVLVDEGFEPQTVLSVLMEIEKEESIPMMW